MLLVPVLSLSGCTVLDVAGDAVGVVGKAAWAGGKTVGGVVYTGTSMVGQTANQTSKTMAQASTARRDRPLSIEGKRAVIPLQQEGKSYYLRAQVNGKVWGRFLVDTGASAIQISKKMAKRLHVDEKNSQAIPVTLAGGGMVVGRLVTLQEVRLGTLAVKNVKAIILDYENSQQSDGLLGMTFLENFVFSIDTKKSELILEKRK